MENRKRSETAMLREARCKNSNRLIIIYFLFAIIFVLANVQKDRRKRQLIGQGLFMLVASSAGTLGHTLAPCSCSGNS